MDYTQERIATLHDLTNPTPTAPIDDSAIVVPIAGDSVETTRPAHVFETLEIVDPGTVVVPLRAPPAAVDPFRQWVDSFDLSVTVLWCSGDAVESMLADHGIGGEAGKGRDVWIGLGVAAELADYVAVHDADATTYSTFHVPRLLAPLEMGYEFVKGYYARVEDGKLYGRLARLLVAPLLRALEERHDEAIVRYLSAFRYPLAGEFAFTAEAARQVRAQRRWGLEIGLLGEAYASVGESRTAQADLGVHRHDHRPVNGSQGLSTMAEQVSAALFRVLEDRGVTIEYESIVEAYRTAADELVGQYEADARFNGLQYDAPAEREQYRVYASSVTPPGADTRLPAWNDAPLAPSDIVTATRDATVEVHDPTRWS